MDPQVKAVLDRLETAFAAFKAANDEAHASMARNNGTVDPLLATKVDKANADVTALSTELKAVKDALKEVETANARVSQRGTSEAQAQERTYALQLLNLTRPVGARALRSVSDEQVEAYRKYVTAQAEYFRRGQQALEDPEIRNALQTGITTKGDYWLSPETSGRVITFLEDLSSLRSLATVESIGTDTYEGFYDLDEADSGWVGEVDARPNTNEPRIDGAFQFPIHEQYANPKTTQKMLDDSENDVEGWLARKVAAKLAKTENTAFVSGNGIKKPMGFLSQVKAAGGPARTSVINYRKIGFTKTGANGAYVAAPNSTDCFIDIIQSMPSELRAGAMFAMNSLTLAATRKLKDTEGRYVFIPDFTTNPSGSILSHGIAELSDMPDIANDAYSIAFANFKEGYLIKDHKVGIRVLRDPYTNKPYVQFYTTKRVGGDVVNFQAIKLLQFKA
jgi:HK97 family phage major capsid protein